MSIIIGLKDKNGVYIASDSQSSNNIKHIVSEQQNMKIKVIHKNPNLIIGHAGSAKSSAVHELLKDEFNKDSNIIKQFGYEYILNEFIGKMLELENKHRLFKKDDFPKYLDGDTLIGFKDRLFVIQKTNGGVVLEANEYACVGSGSAIAIGSLESSKGLEPLVRLRLALYACKEFDSYVDQPFLIFHTNENEYRKIELNKVYEVKIVNKELYETWD